VNEILGVGEGQQDGHRGEGEVKKEKVGIGALLGSCGAVFWPGAMIFGFPGVAGQYWRETFGVDRAAVGQTLFFVLAGTGLFMYLIGRWQVRFGHATMAGVGGILCALSTWILGSASGMSVVYGCTFLIGVAAAFVYIPTLTVVQFWYPQRRGFATGMVSMVFGLSAALMSPLIAGLLLHWGYGSTTRAVSLITLATGLVAAWFVRMPRSPSLEPRAAPSAGMIRGMTVREALQTRAFWLLWFTWVLAGAGGIAMVTLSTAFGHSMGLLARESVLLLTAFNITNGLGRYLSGHVSDRIGRNRTMAATFLAAGCAYGLFSHLQGLLLWSILAALVGLAFGTLFAVSAPLASECFGMKHFGAVFGLVFTAYGFVAGPLGPWLSGYILDATGGRFDQVFGYLGVSFLAAALLIWFVRPGPEARDQRSQGRGQPSRRPRPV
jgi:OFA family oxalate/formate antiporter-like MFS transporter